MDLQAGLVSIYVKEPEFIGRAANVLKLARAAGLLVVHVRVGFRPTLPEVSSHNLLLGAIKASPQHQKLFEGAIGAINQAVSAV
jgi:nicotinamidase-related amidase